MPITDQYWQYAKEAILSACDAKTDDDRQGLLELARTWDASGITRAAVHQLRNGQAALTLVPLDTPGNVRKVLDAGPTNPHTSLHLSGGLLVQRQVAGTNGEAPTSVGASRCF